MTDFVPIPEPGRVEMLLNPGDDGDAGEHHYSTYEGKITLDGVWVHCNDDGFSVPAHRVLAIWWGEGPARTR